MIVHPKVFHCPNEILIHFVHDQLTSSQEPDISNVCLLSLSILVRTHCALYNYSSNTLYLSTPCVQPPRTTVLPSLFPTLVHFVHNQLTSSQDSRARHQHRMSSLFINSGTYTLCSILFFFQYNLSICYLRLASKNNSPSFFKANSNYYYNQKLEDLAMFSHTNISVGQWKTFGWTIIEIFVGKMLYYIMNCRINWSRNKRGVLQVFNSLHTSFRGYLGPKSHNQT